MELKSETKELVEYITKAYQPLLQKLSLSTKLEIHRLIYEDTESITDEMAGLGCAIWNDKEVREYVKETLGVDPLSYPEV